MKCLPALFFTVMLASCGEEAAEEPKAQNQPVEQPENPGEKLQALDQQAKEVGGKLKKLETRLKYAETKLIRLEKKLQINGGNTASSATTRTEKQTDAAAEEDSEGYEGMPWGASINLVKKQYPGGKVGSNGEYDEEFHQSTYYQLDFGEGAFQYKRFTFYDGGLARARVSYSDEITREYVLGILNKLGSQFSSGGRSSRGRAIRIEGVGDFYPNASQTFYSKRYWISETKNRKQKTKITFSHESSGSQLLEATLIYEDTEALEQAKQDKFKSIGIQF